MSEFYASLDRALHTQPPSDDNTRPGIEPYWKPNN